MSHFYSSSTSTQRDPGMAATLSLVPGLGQFYNGQSRKGILFLDVAAINFVLLWMMVFNAPITQALTELGKANQMKLNGALISALQQIQLGTPGSFVILGLILTFVGFAVRDAHENASRKRRKALYGDSVIDLTEATSGAYIFHVSLLLSLAIFAMFFFVPKPVPRQVTDIEFLPQPQMKQVVKPPVTRVHSTKAAVDHGRVSKSDTRSQKSERTNTPHTKAESNQQQTTRSEQSKAEQSKSAAQSNAGGARETRTMPVVRPNPVVKPAASSSAPPVPQPMKSATPPTPTFMPRTAAGGGTASITPTPTKLAFNMPSAPSLSARMPNARPISTPAVPLPTLNRAAAGAAPPMMLAPTSLTASSSGAAPAMPTPAAARSSGTGLPSGFSAPSIHTGPLTGSGVPSVGPAGFPRSSNSGNSIGGPGTGPSMVPATSGTGTGPAGSRSGPSPKEIGGGRNGSGSGPAFGTGPGISPMKSHGGNDGTGSGPVIVPTGGPSAGSKDTGSGVGPKKDTDNLVNSHEAVGNPDFGPYMSELQRRIKRAWFPARADLSHRVVVVFKIHSNGQCSDVSIKKSSGISRHDQAAVEAVQNAAPFAPLPKYSPDAVDIEFTFDYNVFSGGR